MKTAIIALSAAALIAVVPAAFAQGASSKSPGVQHKVSKKRHPGVSGHAPRREMQATGSKKGFNYTAPGASMEPNPNGGGGGGM